MIESKDFLGYVERFARLEGKVDLVLANQIEDKVFKKEVSEKIEHIEDRVAQIETEKNIWGRVITGAVGFLGVFAGKLL